ncbi:MAG: hypothetical protein ACK2TV_08110, partial [Anaerolineales bacterium]
MLPYIKNKTINFCVKKGSVSSVWAHHKILAQKGHSAYGNILVSLTCCNMFESRNDKITRPNSRDLIIKSSYAKRRPLGCQPQQSLWIFTLQSFSEGGLKATERSAIPIRMPRGLPRGGFTFSRNQVWSSRNGRLLLRRPQEVPCISA